MAKESLEKNWEKIFSDYFVHAPQLEDASHDLGHFRRVANTAKLIAAQEPVQADHLILLAAAYFHDIVSLPKNHPENKMSSRYAAKKAQEILLDMKFPIEKIVPVCHAIETHSFSAKLTPQTIEAKIIQDADRMESLGALGILRTFYVSGRLERAPYDPTDLFASKRPLDDKAFGLDHFYCKLFKLPALLQTEGARRIVCTRTDFLRFFVNELALDVERQDGGALALVLACYEAGRNSLKLFDTEDPFGSKRELAPHHYVVDRLITKHNQYPQFIAAFVTQLTEEVYI